MSVTARAPEAINDDLISLKRPGLPPRGRASNSGTFFKGSPEHQRAWRRFAAAVAFILNLRLPLVNLPDPFPRELERAMSRTSAARPQRAFLLLACSTALGLAGTDLVLPAIPVLPSELGGNIASAQLVIAAFVAGTAAGLLLFGAIGARYGRWAPVWIALAGYAAVSLAAGFSRHVQVLITLRFLQGLAASAPAVFAPSVLRTLFSEASATRALGVLGSVESVVPALAPVLGAKLTAEWGWPAPFFAIAGSGAVAAAAIALNGGSFPHAVRREAPGSYGVLLRSPVFLRYALSQACVLGGLLLFVFGAPTVIVTVLHGTISDFVWMQVAGISCFVLAATATGHIVPRLGAERMIWIGTWLAACGAVAIVFYAALGGRTPRALIALFIPLNLGLGVRGPPGFFRAIRAGRGDDERAASLTVFAIMTVAAASTTALAPLLGRGLLVLASACALMEALGLALLAFLPRLPESAHGMSTSRQL